MDGPTAAEKVTMTDVVETAADHLVVHMKREGKTDTLTFCVLTEDPQGHGHEVLAALARYAKSGPAAKE